MQEGANSTAKLEDEAKGNIALLAYLLKELFLCCKIISVGILLTK